MSVSWPLQMISDLRVQDVVDILLLSLLAYCIYAWFWGTKAIKAVVGLAALGAMSAVARFWGLFLTTWVFQVLWQVVVLLVIVLFQPELRQMLERFSPFAWLRSRGSLRGGQWSLAVVEGAFSMARSGVGALIVLERNDKVEELISGGVLLHAETTVPLLMAIFQKESPLHDGAILVRNGEVLRAGCYLPLSSSESIPQHLGTRHRAALGLSERCDAAVIVVSEERKTVSLAMGGSLQELEDPEALGHLLSSSSTGKALGVGRSLWEAVTGRLHVKALCLVIVASIWLVLAGKQDVEVSISVPVETRNLPESWEILEPSGARVNVLVKGMRKDVMSLNDSNVFAELDLSLAKLGRRTFRIGRREIVLPNNRVEVVKVEPSEIRFRFQDRS